MNWVKTTTGWVPGDLSPRPAPDAVFSSRMDPTIEISQKVWAATLTNAGESSVRSVPPNAVKTAVTGGSMNWIKTTAGWVLGDLSSHPAPDAVFSSRMDPKIKISQEVWAVTLIKAGESCMTSVPTKHAMLIIEGLGNDGKPWAVGAHLMGCDVKNKKLGGQVKMHDLTKKPITYAGRSFTEAISFEKGCRLIESIREDAAVSFDPLSPDSRGAPLIREKKVQFSFFGSNSVTQLPRILCGRSPGNSCISYALNKLSEIGLVNYDAINLLTDTDRYLIGDTRGKV